MLQNIQKRLSGWVLWVIVVVISLGFMLWGVENYFQGKSHENGGPIGKVNDLDIYSSEVARALNAVAAQIAAENNNQIPDSVKPLMEKQALNMVISRKIIQSLSKKLGYAYSTEDIEKQILSLPFFYEDGKFSSDKFNRRILNAGYKSHSEFIQELKDNSISEQINSGIAGTEIVTKKELEFWVNFIEQTRDYRYLGIPLDKFAKNTKVSKEEIQEFYDDHRKNFEKSEQIKLDYIEFSEKNVANTIEISEQEIEEYYKENKDKFYQPQRWRVAHISLRKAQVADSKKLAEDILHKLKKGEDFADLARKYSSDKLSSAKGGELFWFKSGSINEKFENAVKQLKKPGDVTDIVELDNGDIEIFKLLEHQDKKHKSLQSIKTEIRSKLLELQSSKKFSSLVDELADVVYSTPDSLDSAAKQFDLPIKTSGYFPRNGDNKDAVAKYPSIVEAAFHEDIYENGNNSLPIRINNSTVIVVRVADKKPARILSLDEVSGELEKGLKLKKSAEKAKVLSEEIVESLVSGKENITSKLIKKHELAWQEKHNVTKMDREESQMLLGLVFSLGDISRNSKRYPNGVISDNEYAIVDVRKISLPDVNEMSEDKKDRIKQYVTRYIAEISFGLYFDGLKSKSKISINKDKQ